MMKDNEEKKKSFWDFLASKKALDKRKQIDFSGLALTHEFHNYLVTGKRDYHYLAYFKDKYLLSGSRPNIASLGCGSGHLERVLVNDFRYEYKEIHGFDINPHLMEFANKEAVKSGLDRVEYFQMDLDNPQLSHSYYDLIIFFHSLHHIENLENSLKEVKKALKDTGLLLIVDFIGPTRFQWSDKQMEIAQELLDILPVKYKKQFSPEGIETGYKTRIIKQSPDAIAQGDPSEAIRSSDIMAAVANEFKIIEKKFMGGTLLSLLFHEIAGNFDETDDSDRAIILLMQKIEELALRESMLESNYIFLVATK
jgi:SAM-dependent methyltransferase